MNSLGLDAGRLRQSLGGAARGGAQQAPDLLRPQDEQDGIHQGRFAYAGTARDDERPAGKRLAERRLLARRKLFARLALAPGHGLLHVDGRVVRLAGRKVLDAGGDAFLGPLQRRQEYQLLVGDCLPDQLAVRQGLLQGGVYDFLSDQEQLARLVLKPLDGQGAVAVAGRLQQDMAEARAGPDE